MGTNSFVAGKETKKPKHICAYASLTIFLLLSRSTPTDISNPNYLGMAPFSQQPSATCQLKQTPSSEQAPSLWNYEQQSKENTSLMGQSHSSSTSPSLSPLSPKPSLQPTASRSICNWSQEYQWVFEFCTEAGLLSPVILHSHCFIICLESSRCSISFIYFISRMRKISEGHKYRHCILKEN